MIKAHLENAVRQILAEKEKLAKQVTERITREVVMPHNAEVDKLRDNAIAELTQKLNAEIAALQEKFNKEKQVIIEASEKNKSNFASTAISTEVYNVTSTCDKVVEELNAQIEKLKE